MDTDLIRDFSMNDTFNFLDQYPHNSPSLDSLHDSRDVFYEWDLINEREINVDLPLIPTPSNYNEMEIKEKSTPNIQNFQKLMDDWLEYVDKDTRCEGFSFDYNLTAPEENQEATIYQKNSLQQENLIAPEENQEATIYQKNLPQEIFSLTDNNAFDIASYLADDDTKPTLKMPSRKRKAAVKKMDLLAQRYIVEDDEDDVDVETISESESSPVLEAGDLNSLLEQFEATEIPELPRELPQNILDDNQDIKIEIEEHCIKQEPDTFKENNLTSKNSIKGKPEVVKVKKESIEKDVVKIKKEYKVDIPEKIEIKNELHNVKKEMKEVQNDTCKVKQDYRQVKTEFKKPKVESAAQIVSEQTSSQVTLKVVTSIQIPTKYSNKNHKEVLPQKIATENKTTKLTKNILQQSTALQQSTLTPTLKDSKKSPESTTSFTQVSTSNYIRSNLPHALIERIKESGKRKTISVIPPIPSKKRGAPRAQDDDIQNSSNKKPKLNSSQTVQLDHDYCSLSSPYPKHPKKDSGFESAEEDDRAIIQTQPMVKNADGKLMVSLLKVNTIHSTSANQKRKLNLEEYKKRRKDIFKVQQNNSQNGSPISSNCSSPLPEDENLRIKKHQQKLMKMAMEVLKTSPKGEKKPEVVVVAVPPTPVQTPADMEKKILVSIGVNTDFKICKNINPVAPVEQLEEMKPLLKKVSAKINCNSLITSLIENIPKVMNQTDSKDLKTNVQTDKLEHGEDKTIIYLPKNRTAVKTSSTAIQTNISLIQQSKRSRYRVRRDSSTSSSSSSSRESEILSHYKRRRESSNCSSVSSRRSRNSHSPYSGSSSSSSYSSRSTTPSRSRSSSPKYNRRERERLREVEERRVIYVGRISSSTTRDDLKRRFQRFGSITNVSLHFRDHGDNYGFVTFANKLDAYEAIEHGNDEPYYPKYDLSFGGRRIFCKTKYSDLDNMRDETNYLLPRTAEDSFDKLLREAQEKLRKRKA